MVKIYIKGKVKEVSKNEAHALIDKGEAELYNPKKHDKEPKGYQTRQLRPSVTK